MAEDKKELAPELKEKLRAEFEKDWRKDVRKSVPPKDRMKLVRQRMPEREPDERNKDFEEVNLGFSEVTALAEAKRCFNCGVCNLCDNCYIFCPDVAVHKKGEDELNEIDYEHCKGCGICMEECPRDVIVMEEEGR